MDAILKASYGDKGQREKNHAVPNQQRAVDVQMAVKLRKAPQSGGFAAAPPSPGRQAYQPPFWDPKVHGVAYGDFNRQEPRPVQYANVEIRPGVLHAVAQHAPQPKHPAGTPPPQQQQQQQQQQQRQRPRPPSGQQRQQQQQQQQAGKGPQKPYQQPTVELGPAIGKLAEAMRQQLKKRASVHEVERTVLLRAFAKVLKKPFADICASDRVTTAQFTAVWKALGVEVPQALAVAAFNRHGQDSAGRLPVLVFVEGLVMGAPRLMMAAAGEIQRGAFQAGRAAVHSGKIQYPQCKKGVWAPSDWDPALAERSARLPDVALQLDFVHGYDGRLTTSSNVHFNVNGDVVYYTAAVCIVYNKASHSQRFFLGHDDDVCCLAMAPDRRTVASGQLGKDPCAIVWDSVALTQLVRLQHGYGNRGIQALCFSPNGSQLATIATDNSHSLFLWDWKAGRKIISERKTQPGAPPAVYGVAWSSFEPGRLATFGQNHIKFWTLGAIPAGAPAGTEPPISNDSGTYGRGGTTHSVLSAVFLPSGILLTGGPEGQICSWKGARLIRETPGHAKGVLTRRPDGTSAYGGVRCLVLQQGNNVLLSGGADGCVIKWDVSSGDLGQQLQRIPMQATDAQLAAPQLTALDCFPGSEVFVAGTSACDLWEVDETPEVLVYGQQGDLCGLATNPRYSHVYATVCDSEKVIVWNALSRKPIRILSLGMKAASCAFSPNGQHLAIGMACGGIKIMEFHPQTVQVWWGKPFTGSIDALKYSPCGRYLAAGSHDREIDIFDVDQGYSRRCRCSGHSSSVEHFDWAQDGSALQSNDQAYEVLHFDPRTGRQLKDSQRDTKWATWTCILGFPVMGIWPSDSDGTDVNSCDASPSGRYLLTADDFGKVKLFNFPCVIEHAPARSYSGHSSHVMNVRWSTDETYAVSLGGKDRSVFQWRLVRPTAKAAAHQALQTPWQALDEKGLVWGAPGGVERCDGGGRRQQQQQQQQQQRLPRPASMAQQAQQMQQQRHRPLSAVQGGRDR